MKNGCKDFVSPTLDKLGIEKYFDNRLNDIIFAQVALEMRNSRGVGATETRHLIDELHEYILYLYEHIEQLERDKRYLLSQRLKEKYKNIQTKER